MNRIVNELCRYVRISVLRAIYACYSRVTCVWKRVSRISLCRLTLDSWRPRIILPTYFLISESARSKQCIEILPIVNYICSTRQITRVHLYLCIQVLDFHRDLSESCHIKDFCWLNKFEKSKKKKEIYFLKYRYIFNNSEIKVCCDTSI